VFVPALKYGFSGVQEAGYALAGRTGLMDEAAAQKAIEEEQAYQQRVFKPTEEGFLEAPVTKTLELLGQSLPFMVLPVAAAGATLALPVHWGGSYGCWVRCCWTCLWRSIYRH
jgi:hypothetical protein